MAGGKKEDAAHHAGHANGNAVHAHGGAGGGGGAPIRVTDLEANLGGSARGERRGMYFGFFWICLHERRGVVFTSSTPCHLKK